MLSSAPECARRREGQLASPRRPKPLARLHGKAATCVVVRHCSCPPHHSPTRIFVSIVLSGEIPLENYSECSPSCLGKERAPARVAELRMAASRAQQQTRRAGARPTVILIAAILASFWLLVTGGDDEPSTSSSGHRLERAGSGFGDYAAQGAAQQATPCPRPTFLGSCTSSIGPPMSSTRRDLHRRRRPLMDRSRSRSDVRRPQERNNFASSPLSLLRPMAFHRVSQLRQSDRRWGPPPGTHRRDLPTDSTDPYPTVPSRGGTSR